MKNRPTYKNEGPVAEEKKLVRIKAKTSFVDPEPHRSVLIWPKWIIGLQNGAED